MTYKDVIDRFKTVADAHYMLKDFGYGQLSDIKVHSQDGEADYPYMFLNPSTHTRNGVNMVYNFNMIVMDVATDEDDALSNYTAIQSKCQQYIDDVIAEMYYGYDDKPEIQYTNVTYTPFKERFQDSVAGMTATISILVPTPINQCIAPFNYVDPTPPEPVICDPEYPNFATSISQFNNTVDTTNIAWRFGTNTVTDPAIGTWSSNVFNNAVLGTFEFIIEADITFTNPGVGETFPPAPTLLVNNVVDVAANCVEDNWPTTYVTGTFRWKARYSVNLQALSPVQIISTTNNFAEYTVAVGATLNIGYQA